MEHVSDEPLILNKEVSELRTTRRGRPRKHDVDNTAVELARKKKEMKAELKAKIKAEKLAKEAAHKKSKKEEALLER